MITYVIKEGFNADPLRSIEGVTVGKGSITFPADWTEERAERVMSFGEQEKQARFSVRSKAVSMDEERGELLGIGIDEEELEYIKVREIKAANTLLDRTDEMFTRGFLEIFSKNINTAPIPMILNHDRRGPVLAKAYSARVEEMDGATWLMVKAYIDERVKLPGQDLTVYQAVKNKYIDSVSVGFTGWPEIKETGDRIVGIYEAPPMQSATGRQSAELHEISFITTGLPAQFGASVKSKSYSLEQPKAEPKHKKSIMEISYNSKSFSVSVDEASKSQLAEFVDNAKSVATERDELKVKLKAYQEAETERRTAITESIKTLEKQALKLPEGEQTSEFMLTNSPIADLEKRKAYLEAKDREINKGGQLASEGRPSEEEPIVKSENVSQFIK